MKQFEWQEKYKDVPKIGIPSQKRLGEESRDVLKKAGYSIPSEMPRTDEFFCQKNNVLFLAVKTFEQIRFMLENKQLDGLITGLDVVKESNAKNIVSLAEFENEKCILSPIANKNLEKDIMSYNYCFTKYPNLTTSWLKEVGFSKRQISNVLQKMGSGTEAQVRRCSPDAFGVEIVQSGASLIKNELEIISGFEPILPDISLQLFASELSLDNQETRAPIEQLQRRVENIIRGKLFSVIEFNVSDEKFSQIKNKFEDFFPGRSPTVTNTTNGKAVKVLVKSDKSPEIQDKLQQLGADSVFTQKIESST